MLPDNLKISDIELSKLVERFGEAEAMDWIEALSLWKASKGKKTKSDYFTILNWARRERKRQSPAAPVIAKPGPGYLEHKIQTIHGMFQRDFELGLRANIPTVDEIRVKVLEGVV